MAKISTYVSDSNVTLSDKLIGTDVDNSNQTKNFTISSIVSLANANLGINQVLNAISNVNQVPSGLNTPLVVSFGPAQGTSQSDVMIDSGGTITFNKSGLYFINGFGNVERQGSSGGTAVLLFRLTLNGNQVSTTKGFHLDTPNLPMPYEVTIPFKANAGDMMRFEIMRDSSGTNAGGIYTHTNLGGWSNVPSSQLQIWKLG